MDANTLKRAAEPFFTTKPMGKGSGLGLSMVHGLVLQSGGALQIDSRPNEGTTVTLWLPVASDQVSSAEARSAPSAAGKSACRVMLVDDDPLILKTTADMLRELGHEAVEMSSGNQALEALQTGKLFDLAILDYAMPDMTGDQLADRIRESFPALPLLLATGYSHGARTTTDMAKLAKPYTIAELSRQIGLLISRRKSSAR
jgi:CheY-like chemotaxis protein